MSKAFFVAFFAICISVVQAFFPSALTASNFYKSQYFSGSLYLRKSRCSNLLNVHASVSGGRTKSATVVDKVDVWLREQTL